MVKMEEKMKGERQLHGLTGELIEMEEIEDAVLDYRLDFG
jgi:hypothetical protein